MLAKGENRISLVGAACAGALVACLGTASMAHAQSTAGNATDQLLGTVVVSGEKKTEAQLAQDRVEEVAGAAAVIDNRQVERGRASNAEDVLALQPGIFAQATSGTSANKISIRGSGLNTFYQGYSLGIKYLYDGMPITGPGGTQEDLLNMAAVNYTEVLYGANAFSYTALALGGAINFVTHSGYSAPGNYARFEVGSFGYRKQQLSTGGVVGDSDYYVSVLHNERDGFQDNTPNEGKDFIGNFGHRFNDKLDTRLIARYREEDLINGGTLTKAQLLDNPKQNTVPAGRKKDGTTLLISKTNYRFDDDSLLEVGLGYNDYPLHNGWRYSATPQDWRSTDTSVSLRYLRQGDVLFGKPSDTSLSFSHTRLNGEVKAYNRSDNSLRQYTEYSGSRDTVFAIGNELQLDERFWLSTGISFIEIDRDVSIQYTTLTNTTEFSSSVSYQDWDVAPRLGFRYQLHPDVQVFGNVSRSIDPPVTWYYGSTGNAYVRPLQPQEGTTLELGVRGSAGIFDGSLTLYRSWIDKELLSVVVIPATSTADAVVANANASKTIHQGIEAGLNTLLWEGRSGNTLNLRQAYTFNDFFYKDDDVFGENQLPSLPMHVYQAELQYQHTSGFYAQLNVRSASNYYVDYANTLKAPSYTLWGAKVGYEAPSEKWSVFLDARNLTDEKYATTTNTAYNLNGNDSANFYPGDGFGVTTGVAFRF